MRRYQILLALVVAVLLSTVAAHAETIAYWRFEDLANGVLYKWGELENPIWSENSAANPAYSDYKMHSINVTGMASPLPAAVIPQTGEANTMAIGGTAAVVSTGAEGTPEAFDHAAIPEMSNKEWTV